MLRSFLLETDCLEACREAGCRHVISWRGVVFSTRGRMGFAMLKAPCTLSSLPMPFTLQLLQRTGFHLLLGLHEIHTLRYVHRDVKPGNMVCWGAPGPVDGVQVQHIDCGVGKRLAHHQTSLGVTPVGTTMFMSPELLLNGHTLLSTQQLLTVDVWSGGVVIGSVAVWCAFDFKRNLFQHPSVQAVLRQGAQRVLQKEEEGGHQLDQHMVLAARIVTKRLPGTSWKPWEVYKLLEEVGISDVLDGCPELADSMGPLGVELLKGMLALEPSNRFSVLKAIRHPFFAGERQHLVANPGAVGDSQPLQQLAAELMADGRCRHGNYHNSCTACLHPG
jgi:serine/threonine protein kinase